MGVRTFQVIEVPNFQYHKDQKPYPMPFPKPPDNCVLWNDISIKKNELVLHILKNREQIESLGRLETKKRLASREACVKSKLSYHIVKFEQSIKRHNFIFLKYHEVSDEVKEVTNHLPRNTFKYETLKKIPKASHMLNMKTVDEMEKKSRKFRKKVHRLIGKINVEKMMTMAEEATDEFFTFNAIKFNEGIQEKLKDEFLERSFLYRRNVKLLHNCDLLKTLIPMRHPLKSTVQHVEMESMEELQIASSQFRPYYISTEARLGETVLIDPERQSEFNRRWWKKCVEDAAADGRNLPAISRIAEKLLK